MIPQDAVRALAEALGFEEQVDPNDPAKLIAHAKDVVRNRSAAWRHFEAEVRRRCKVQGHLKAVRQERDALREQRATGASEHLRVLRSQVDQAKRGYQGRIKSRSWCAAQAGAYLRRSEAGTLGNASISYEIASVGETWFLFVPSYSALSPVDFEAVDWSHPGQARVDCYLAETLAVSCPAVEEIIQAQALSAPKIPVPVALLDELLALKERG